MTLESHCVADTERIGERLAHVAGPGSVIGLIGPLGAGKTALVRGLARACGVDEGTVSSPTFITAAEYQGRIPVAHVDLYRHEEILPDPDWLAEVLDGDGVAVVEWFERLADATPPDAVTVRIAYGTADDHRLVEVSACGPRAEDLLRAFERNGTEA